MTLEYARLAAEDPRYHKTRKASADAHSDDYNLGAPILSSAQILDLHEWSTTRDVQDYLRKILQSHSRTDDTWDLHQSPIAFKDGRVKQHWSTFEDTEDLDLFITFLKGMSSKKAMKPIEIYFGFFITWTTNWVGKPVTAWKETPWHAWGAVCKKAVDRSGYDLFIWDSNAEAEHPPDTPIRFKAIGGQQRVFITWFKTQRKVATIYIGGHGNGGEGECMRLTGNWIESCVRSEGSDFKNHGTAVQAGYRRVQGGGTEPLE